PKSSSAADSMARARGPKPRGERTRATVTCPRNGRFSGTKPSGSQARWHADASRPRSSTAPRIPAQTTRGRGSPGKAPRPRPASSRGETLVAAVATALRTSARSPSDTSPRNWSVRCMPAGSTQRRSAFGARARRRPWVESSADRTASDRSTAMKQRTIRPGGSAVGLGRGLVVARLAAALAEPAAHGLAHLSLELPPAQDEPRLLRHGADRLWVPEAVRGHGGEIAIDRGGLLDELRELRLVLFGMRQRRPQLLVDRLPLGDELDATLVRLAEDGAQGERLVVGQVEGVDQP